MKISMIGAGQQGVSQGLAFARLADVTQVVFYDTDLQAAEILRKAQEFGIDTLKINFAKTIKEAQHNADVTALNVPMNAFERTAYDIARFSAPGTIMYDNGSGKTQAIKDIHAGLSWATLEGYPALHYVPAHFFVGRAGTGPSLADPAMYDGGTAALITQDADADAVAILSTLFKNIGVKNLRTDLSAKDHDESLGFYSHHNTFAQTSLMRAFPATHIAQNPVNIGTFLGSTRVAETGKDGVSMWGPIAVDNALAIASAGHIVLSKLGVVDQALDDPHTLRTILGQAHEYVAAHPEDRPAESFYGDIYDLRRQADPTLPVPPQGGADVSAQTVEESLRPYIASHVAMPVVFAAASVLGARCYEEADGQPFSSINNSSFYGTMRPLRNDVDDMAALLEANKDAVHKAIDTLKTTHQALVDSILGHETDAVASALEQSQAIRSRLPRERTAQEIRPAFKLG